jgi:hypothetical protein
MSILPVADNRFRRKRAFVERKPGAPRERGAHPFAVIEKMTCGVPQGETAEAADIAHLRRIAGLWGRASIAGAHLAKE